MNNYLKIASFDVNTKGKDFFVSPIFGRFRLLVKMLDKIGFNKKTDRLFSFGNLIKENDATKTAYKWLMCDWFHSTRGHAEDTYIKNFNHNDNNALDTLSLFNNLPYIIEIKMENGLIGLSSAKIPDNITWNMSKELLNDNNEYLMNRLLDCNQITDMDEITNSKKVKGIEYHISSCNSIADIPSLMSTGNILMNYNLLDISKEDEEKNNIKLMFWSNDIGWVIYSQSMNGESLQYVISKDSDALA